jgi:hypothetical protein
LWLMLAVLELLESLEDALSLTHLTLLTLSQFCVGRGWGGSGVHSTTLPLTLTIWWTVGVKTVGSVGGRRVVGIGFEGVFSWQLLRLILLFYWRRNHRLFIQPLRRPLLYCWVQRENQLIGTLHSSNYRE